MTNFLLDEDAELPRHDLHGKIVPCRSNPAIAIWYYRVDGSPGMIRLSVYLLPKDVLHRSHDE